MKRLLLLTLLVLLTLTAVHADDESYQYTHPRANAELVATQTTIGIRHGGLIDAGTISAELFQVTGSLSGNVTGATWLSPDGKTILFKPTNPFTPNETVDVVVADGVQLLDGTNLMGMQFAFIISPLASNPPLDVERAIARLNLPPPSQNAGVGAQPVYQTVPPDLPPVYTLRENSIDESGYLFFANFRWGDIPNSRSFLQIWDDDGDLVYYKQMDGLTVDFKKQPTGVLSYFSAASGVYELMDASYTVIDTVQAGHGYPTDLHELLLLENGHALLMVYDEQPVDMSAIVAGGDPDALVEGLIIQELDAERNVIFEWRSWDDIPITDAVDIDLTAARIDYIHGNSIAVDQDNHLLISSRHTNEVTKLDRNSAEIIWRLGGKQNEFTLLNTIALFARQHDARRLPDGTLSLFDNRTFPNGDPQHSRAVRYALDEVNKTIREVDSYRQRLDSHAQAMGNVQYLPNGNRLVGWGSGSPTLTEIRDGERVLELSMPYPNVSYRAFRFDWQGEPQPPVLTLGGDGTLYFSTNGATVGDRDLKYVVYADDETLATPFRSGFEDSIWLGPLLAEFDKFHVVLQRRGDPSFRLTSETLTLTHLYLPYLTGNRTTEAPEILELNDAYYPFSTVAPYENTITLTNPLRCFANYCPTLVADTMRFNGINQSLYSTVSRPYSYGFTFAATIRTSEDTEWAGILSTDDDLYYTSTHTRPDKTFAQMVLSDTGTLRVEINGGQFAGNKVYDGTTVINDGEWHSVAFTYDVDTQELKLFVDGAEEVNPQIVRDDSIIAKLYDNRLQIGVNRDQTIHFAGDIDVVMVLDRVISAAEYGEWFNANR